VIDGNIIVVDAFSFEQPKTKLFAESLKSLDVQTKALVVLEDGNDQAALAARNLPNVSVVSADGINVLDVVANDKLILTQAALSQVEEALA
jgi:large subunit ribosomal protein L4